MPFSEKIRKKVRQRAHLQCCLCKALGVEVHHILPQEENGPDTEDNAAPLCPSCHETYGANPAKRKFIREARDLWYEICEKRYASDASRIDELKELLKNSITYEDFRSFKEEIMDIVSGGPLQTPRNEEEILEALDKLWDQVWYNRHLNLAYRIKHGMETVDSQIWKQAKAAARRVRDKYSKADLGPWTDFEWGMINGKMSALRWVLGDEWDFLDT